MRGHRTLMLPMPIDVESLIAALPPQEAERTRKRLGQLAQTCACGFGVAGALAALALYGTGLVLWLDLTAHNPWTLGAIGFAGSVAGAGAGKFLGLMRARRQRNRLLAELHARVSAAGGVRLGARRDA